MADLRPPFLAEQPTLLTDRLRILPFAERHAPGMFAMDSNPRVHRYLGTAPTRSLEEAAGTVRYVMDQYAEWGIGRWAVEDRETGDFLGWTAFKWLPETFHGHGAYLDLGYRFAEAYWGQGFAKEAARASLDFALQHETLCELPIGGSVIDGNVPSERILLSVGLTLADRYACMGGHIKFFRHHS